MPPKRKSDLNDTDVEFLKAVRDLTDNPDQYPKTDRGKAAANTSSLREVTDLTRRELGYRMRPGEDNRGFGEDGLGYIRIYPAPVENGVQGARSVEITEEGRQALAAVGERWADEGQERAGGQVPAELEVEINELRTEVKELRETLEGVQESEYGAVDMEVADRIQRILTLIADYHTVFTNVLGVNPQEVDEKISAEEARENVAATLGVTGEGTSSTDLGQSGEQRKRAGQSESASVGAGEEAQRSNDEDRRRGGSDDRSA